MKTLYLFLIILLSTMLARSQTINIGLNQTVAVIFNQKIKHADIGATQGIGFQLEDSISNILKIRINEYFPSIQKTNMLVVTITDKIFSFKIQFKPDNEQFTYPIPDSLSLNTEIDRPVLKDQNVHYNKDSVYKILISKNDFLPRIICNKQGKIVLSLNNIYTKDSIIYLCCALQNRSNLTYNIDFSNMYITDQKKMKAITMQDIPVNFSYLIYKPTIIPPQSVKNFIIEVPKFTMEKNKTAIFEIFEKSGGRHPRIKLDNSTLIEAKILE